eukprot:Pgem_evm1s17561
MLIFSLLYIVNPVIVNYGPRLITFGNDPCDFNTVYGLNTVFTFSLCLVLTILMVKAFKLKKKTSPLSDEECTPLLLDVSQTTSTYSYNSSDDD